MPDKSRPLTNAELLADRLSFQAVMGQRNPTTALEGELGIFQNPDGSRSSEKSATTEVNGEFINFPLLVRGQDESAIQRILSGNPTKQDIRRAQDRAFEREKGGLTLPRFNTLDEAVKAAGARSSAKGKGQP